MLKVYGTGNDLNLQETYRLCNCMITTISQHLEQFSTPSTVTFGDWRKARILSHHPQIYAQF